MGAAREPDQADFDLERFIDMFDTAMTSSDPRVVETLRKLMMIVALTAPETGSVSIDRQQGPLRRMFDDMNSLHRRVSRMEEEQRDILNKLTRDRFEYNRTWDHQDKYTMAAASQIAQTIDADVMSQVSKDWAMQVNGGKWPKGKLK
jgi:hypothetical protein